MSHQIGNINKEIGVIFLWKPNRNSGAKNVIIGIFIFTREVQE